MTPSDVKIVAENINDFIEVPDGVSRLRKAVLTLAVSGRLVPQDENEGTAESLLKIKSEKSATPRKKQVKELGQVSKEETPFQVPESWKWVRLGCVTNYGLTDKCKPQDFKKGVWVLELEDLEKEGGRLLATVRYPERSSLSDKNIFKKGDVLYGKLRPYLNKVIVAGEDGVCSSELMPIRWSIDSNPDFLRWVLLSDYFSQYVNKITYGIKMPRLGTEDGRNAVIPLPPLAEQNRIVRKVDELMKQLDELESQKNERDQVRSRLTKSGMEALGSANSKIALDLIIELVKTPQDIKELENAILTLAVTGKIAPTETNNWIVAKFSDKNLLNIVDGDRGTNYPSKSEFTNEGYCLFLNTSNVRKGEFNFSRCDFITKEKDESLRKGRLVREDVVLTTRGTIGNTAYFSNDIPFENMRINSGMVILRCDTSKIFPPYLITFLNSSIFIAQTNKLMSGSAQQQLPIRVLNEVFFPLPPLAEQKRIVKKVEELMLMVNELKKLIT